MPKDIAEELNKKINPKEFIAISKWGFRFIYNLSPKFTIIFAITAVIAGLYDIANTYILSRLIDILVEGIKNQSADYTQAKNFVLITFGFSMLRMATNFTSRWARIHLTELNRYGTTREFYKKLNTLGIQMLERPDINDRIHRADMYMNNLLPYFFSILDTVTVIVKLTSLILVVSAYLPLYILIILLIALPYYLLDKKQRSNLYAFINGNTEKRRLANSNSHELTNTNRLKEVTLTQAFNFFENRYWTFNQWFSQTRIDIMMKWRKQSNIIFVFLEALNMYFVYNIVIQALKGIISTGDMLFRYRSLDQLQGALLNTISLINDLSEQAIQLNDVYFVFKMEPEVADGTIEISKLNSGPEITLKDIKFIYPNSEKLIFNGLNMHIKPGEKIAIVGVNGAGKTTLVKLICKLYSLNSGKILINKTDLADLKIESWHKNIGILFQDYNAYGHLTVKENIAVGNPTEPIDEIAIRLAAEQAEASEFINAYPKKYEQLLSEKYKGGVRPSSGQWQKLAIARFFYRNSPLVIFDEPTASIDAVSEFNIFTRIYEFFKGKTVIIISHRFSTVRNADRIFVLDGGKIIEQGTHQDLMKMNGKYAESFMLQAKGYVDTVQSIV